MDIEGKSLDIKAEKLAELKRILPELFTENRLDLSRIRELLGDDSLAEQYHYELGWAGKLEARKEIQKQTSATLRPDRKGSVNFDDAQHLFIEGENLEVLHILQKSYFGRVKMVFIDPPYNTGNDSFIYPDDYAELKAEYQKSIGIRNESGLLNKDYLFRKNSRDNGQYHSVWLSMMYPRLYLARNLLSEDGSIFITIDDNEHANLRLIMDEIFGEENFVANIIWHSKYTIANDARYVSSQHENVLFYAKNKESFQIGLLDRTAKMDDAYSNPDNDPRGVWKATPLHAKSGNNTYEFTFDNGMTWTPVKGTYPRYSKNTLKSMYEDNRIYFGKNGSSAPSGKTFLSEVKQGKTVGSIWSYKEVGSSHAANEELSSLLGKGIFDNPKPTNLVRHCLKVAGTGDDSIIVDFFAGSGTTAEAVLEMNRADGLNRRFVTIQLPEPTGENSEAYRSGYKSISEISRARITKTLERIEENDGEKMDFAKPQPNLGVKCYSLTVSNFKKWQDEISSTEQLEKQLEIFQEPLAKRVTDTYELLVELLLRSGIDLATSIQRRKSADEVPYFYLDSPQLVYALDGISATLLTEIEKLSPVAVVTLGSFFSGSKADELLTNWRLQLAESGIEFRII